MSISTLKHNFSTTGTHGGRTCEEWKACHCGVWKVGVDKSEIVSLLGYYICCSGVDCYTLSGGNLPLTNSCI